MLCTDGEPRRLGRIRAAHTRRRFAAFDRTHSDRLAAAATLDAHAAPHGVVDEHIDDSGRVDDEVARHAQSPREPLAQLGLSPGERRGSTRYNS